MMFNFLKSNEEKVRDRFKKNLELYNKRAKKFHIQPSYQYLWQYLIESIRFLYSIHQLKNTVKQSISSQITLKIDTIQYIAAIVENILTFKKELEFFKPEVLFYKLFEVERATASFYKYHFYCVSKHLKAHLYSDFKHHAFNDFKQSHDFYLRRTEKSTKHNDWNYFLNRESEEFISELKTFLFNHSDKILPSNKAEEETIDKCISNTISYDYHSFKTNNNFKPNLFPTFIVDELKDQIDNFLVKRLNINVEEIEVDPKEAKPPYRLPSESAELEYFRNKVANAFLKADQSKSEVLLTSNGKIELNGQEIRQNLYDFMVFNSFSKITSYKM